MSSSCARRCARLPLTAIHSAGTSIQICSIPASSRRIARRSSAMPLIFPRQEVAKKASTGFGGRQIACSAHSSRCLRSIGCWSTLFTATSARAPRPVRRHHLQPITDAFLDAVLARAGHDEVQRSAGEEIRMRRVQRLLPAEVPHVHGHFVPPFCLWLGENWPPVLDQYVACGLFQFARRLVVQQRTHERCLARFAIPNDDQAGLVDVAGLWPCGVFSGAPAPPRARWLCERADFAVCAEEVLQDLARRRGACLGRCAFPPNCSQALPAACQGRGLSWRSRACSDVSWRICTGSVVNWLAADVQLRQRRKLADLRRQLPELIAGKVCSVINAVSWPISGGSVW